MLRICFLVLIYIIESKCQQVIKIPGIGTLIGSTTNTLWTNQTIYQFLGVKYAKSPSGERRFKSPEPSVTGFEYIYTVNQYGKPCPNFNDFHNMTAVDPSDDLEDCLHMSIYTKNISTKAPCMIFIHGNGANSANSKMYPPNFLLEKDIVFISIQYRLGAFGFLSTQSADIPGNAGLLDVILSLQFVKAYIRHFGGDPDQVTLFGGSTGATIISSLIMNPKIPTDLFHRAILQSGSFFSPFSFDEDPIATARRLLRYTNCPRSDSVAQMNSCLKNLNPRDLAKATNDFYTDQVLNGKSPWTQFKMNKNDVQPFGPVDCLISNATIKNIPLMAGVTKNDGSYTAMQIISYLNKTHSFDDGNYVLHHFFDKLLFEYTGLRDYSGSFKYYLQNFLFGSDLMSRGNITNILNGIKDFIGTYAFKAPTFLQAQLMSENNPHQTFLYTFDYLGEHSMKPYWNNDVLELGNEIHCMDDCLYLFPTFNFNAKDMEIAKNMVDLWTSFAITGYPRSSKIPNWPSLTNFIGPYLHIDRKSWIGNNFFDEFSINSKEAKEHFKQNNSPLRMVLSNLLIIFCLILIFV